MSKNKAAQELGKRGGQSRSVAKQEAARKNGAKGGRPKKSPKWDVERGGK